MSDSDLVNKKSNSSGFAKILQWDPWHKIRRNKKEKVHLKKIFALSTHMLGFLACSVLSCIPLKLLQKNVFPYIFCIFNSTKNSTKKAILPRK